MASSQSIVKDFTIQVFNTINVVGMNSDTAIKFATSLAATVSTNFVATFDLVIPLSKSIYDAFNNLASTIFTQMYLGQSTLSVTVDPDILDNPIIVTDQQETEKILENYYFNASVNSISLFTVNGILILLLIVFIIVLVITLIKRTD